MYSNFDRKMHRSWDIRLVTNSDLKTRITGQSVPSEPTRIDSPPMISY